MSLIHPSAEVKDTLPPLGFIAIEVYFHRAIGDPFNSATWPFPLIHEKAEGSTQKQVVTGSAYDPAFLDRFVDAGNRLTARGCVGIITSCGFLAMAQKELARRLPIPIATSALVQIPSIIPTLPGSRSEIGVLTYDDTLLGKAHLEAIGVAPAFLDQIHIRGAPSDGHLRRLCRDADPYTVTALQAELLEVATKLVRDIPRIGALVLECTQMPPFAEAIQEVTGVPVYDAYTNGCWFYSGLVRRRAVNWGVPQDAH